jgi:cell division protein FtsN
MRIDYSEPKKSCSSPQPSQNSSRKESSGGMGMLLTVFITAIISLGIGFGSGWMVSQRSAKKAFKAAMEQQSLENSPQQTKTPPRPEKPALPAPASAPPQQAPTDGTQPAGGSPSATEPPLSFYKTLPGGQKNTALGSGINAKDEKTGKQPLQAPMPTNITRPAAPQDDEEVQKAPPQAVPAQSGKSAPGGYTVQVASYSLKSEAETLRGTLAAKGYNVGIVESHLADKGTWYRVRVGRRLDPDAAKELAKKLGKGAMAIPDKD